MVLQAVLGGDPATSAGPEALTDWVCAVTHGGSGLLGVALAVLPALHVTKRWGRDLEVAPQPPRW
jgi:hypothetical protein